ncbi:hypothetical protein HIM_11834 [Hirsutella minnesotensis 3608]|uniref:Uncharacterized protein n=1 Tax=Hirsutella minnesotensis 3608 TaxID=1043627 RepID=A0A0F7ZWD4_9HYPO|nr:hypothetical protein HIM_11834 [Hirsutella minnesotensis 3608]
MPSDMINELRKVLEKKDFRYCAALTHTGGFDILVQIKPGGSLTWTSRLTPSREHADFHPRESRAWELQCCWDALESDARVWWKCLRETDDKTVFGDRRLPYDLLDEMKVVGREGEI